MGCVRALARRGDRRSRAARGAQFRQGRRGRPDVFAAEPPVDWTLSHPRLIATPHIGAQTVEAQERAAEDIAHEVLAALNGKDLRWRVA